MEGYIGEVRGFAANFSPRNWSYCAGQLIAISQNTALFSIIGTVYGGDGRTTFALPDLRGRAPINSGTGPGLTPRVLGQFGGSETNTMTLSNMAQHTHFVMGGVLPVSGSMTATMNVNNANGTKSNPSGLFLGVENGGLGLYESSADSTMNAAAVTIDTSTLTASMSGMALGNTGSGTPINNMQPYLTINWIICMMGIFPSRN